MPKDDDMHAAADRWGRGRKRTSPVGPYTDNRKFKNGEDIAADKPDSPIDRSSNPGKPYGGNFVTDPTKG
jgi:hypothetical protein